MSDTLHDDFVVQLAGLQHPDDHLGDSHHGPRRVATPQGAQFYGQPIGTIITKDLLDKIHAEKGAPPKGATAPIKQKSNGGNAHLGTPAAANPSAGGAGASGGASNATAKTHVPVGGNIYKQPSYPAPGINSEPPEWIKNPPKQETPQLALGIHDSTIDGPNKFDVGTSHYAAPEGSRLFRPKDNSEFAIVVTPDKQIHFFTSKGEVQADPIVKKVLGDKFAGKLKPDDPHYVEQNFGSKHSLEQMAVGTHLHDKQGNKIFTKTDNGFVHSDLGIPVDAAAIQHLHDSGELTTKPKKVAPDQVTPDFGNDSTNEIDFGSMTLDEFKAYVNTLEKGDKLYLTTGNNSGDNKAAKEYTSLTYQGDGHFKSETGSNPSVASLAFIRQDLRTIEPTHLNKVGTQAAAQASQDAFDQKVRDTAAAKKAADLGIAPPKTPEMLKAEAQQQFDAAIQKAADKAAKKVADNNAVQKDAATAVAEHSAIQDQVSKLNDYQKKKLLDSNLGDAPSLTFLGNALDGSQVTHVTKHGNTVYTKKGKVWTDHAGNSKPLKGEPNLHISKNVFASETDTWEPANAHSQDKVGDAPSIDFLNTAPVGSVVERVSGGLYHKTADGNWVQQKNVSSDQYSAMLDPAAKGEFKIHTIGDGNVANLHIGDQISTGSDKAKLYDQATPGTTVSFIPFSHAITAGFEATLTSDGVWKTNSPNHADSFELPAKPSGVDGHFWVSNLGGGEKKKLGVGDHPDHAWMEHAPVGAGIIDSAGLIAVKKENGLWGTPGPGEGMLSPAGFGKTALSEHWHIGDPNENWNDHVSSSSSNTHKAGDVVTYADLLTVPVGTQFHYHKKDGTLSNYSKLNENEVLMPEGVIQPLHHWQGSIDKGKVTYAHDVGVAEPHQPTVDLPDPITPPNGNPAHDAKVFENYTQDLNQAVQDIKDLSTEKFNPDSLTAQDLQNLGDGAVVEIGGEEFTKNGDLWYPENGELGDGVASEDLSVFAGENFPIGLNWDPNPKQPTIADTIQQIETPNINMPMAPDVPAVSQLQIHEAIAALEAHPHGSPVYGLKTLGDSNPLKTHSKGLIEAAQAVFPKHKPKAAVLSYLKYQVETHDSLDNIDEANNPPIHLGNDKAVKNAFGVTGGDFKQSEIEQAISIIEHYDGKLYKSQLTNANNPLGKLDFNTLVGPNKDKLAQKKAVLEHLKAAINDLPPVKKNESVDPATADVMKLPEQLDALPVEQTVHYDSASGPVVFIKNHEGQWDAVNTGLGNDWTAKDLLNEAAHAGSDLKLGEEDSSSLQNLTSSDVNALPVGSQIVYHSPTAGDHVLSKKPDGNWLVSSGDLGGTWDSAAISEAAKSGHVDLLSTPDTHQTDITVNSMKQFHDLPIGSVVKHSSDPTEYTKTGDNLWEYPLSSGGSETLSNDAFGGAINSGYLHIVGKPNDIPQQFVANPAVQQHPDSVDALNGMLPGVYDSPGGFHHAYIYSNGTVTVQGPDKTESFDSVASALKFYGLDQYTYNPPTASTNLPSVPVKKTAKVKKPFVAFNPKDVPDGNYFFGHSDSPDTPVWVAKGGEVHVLGSNEKVSPLKLKYAFLQGKLVDNYGNSAVLPENHSGTVKFLNKDTTADSLKSLHDALNKDDFPLTVDNHPSVTNYLSLYGLYTDSKFYDYVKQTAGNDVKKALLDTIEGIVGKPDTWKFHDKEGQVMSSFEWKVGSGQAYFPEYAAKHFTVASSWYKSNSEATATIKDIAENFGDGHTIGQHVNGMNIHQKRQWLKAFSNGDFKAMYKIEVDAASKKGLSHAAGWKHPGYADNTITNKVDWAPAVMGEVPAITESAPQLPGSWSPVTEVHNASIDEINNYLLAANMQYPTQLFETQKRQWVVAHRTGNQFAVNNLSVLAKQYHDAGEAPKSAPPIWTDNVKPPKAYNAYFSTNQPYPDGWTSAVPAGVAAQFYDDFVSGEVKVKDPVTGNDLPPSAMKEHMDEVMSEYPNMSQIAQKAYAVDSLFEHLRDAHAEFKTKPIYTKSPVQNVKGSKHPIFNYHDQFGNKYLFKPAANDPAGTSYRAKVEATASKISRFFGGRAPETHVVTIDGKIGFMQKEVPHVKTLNGFNWDKAEVTQGIDLAHEHLIDWMLDQDDNWAPNTLLTPDGHLVGIDKGRTFLNYGAWNGMVSHKGMDVNTHLVYSDMYDAIKNKKISKETADKIWLATQKRANQMSKANDAALLELLHTATDDRKTWQVSYKIDGKPVPSTQQGFIDAFFDRKKKLPQQVEALWKDIYEKAGYGALPEPAPTHLGDNQHSGLDDSNLHTTVMKVGSVGSSTLVGSPNVIGGTATVFGHKNSDGSKDISAQMYLGPKKQGEALNWFKANSDASALSSVKADPTDFPSSEYDNSFGAKFIAAAKTVGAHAEDGGYNQNTLQSYTNAKHSIAKDQAFWNSDLQPDAGQEYVTFPSGAQVPFSQVDQYKMMLDYYAGKQDIIDSALASKTKPSDIIHPYSALPIDKGNVVYFDGNGQKLVKLANGSWIYTNSDLTSIISNDEAAKLYGNPDQSWTKWKDTPEAPKVVYKAVIGNTHEKAGVFSDFELTETGTHLSGGNGGHEYQVTLPTGELIYFRNSKHTDTKRGQEGRLTVRVLNAKNESDIATGMANAQSWLETNLGMQLDAADHNNAELLYWREMYGILENRKHKAGSKWAKAKAELDKKIEEVGGPRNHFLETFAEKASVDEQNQFFRKLWGDHFGADKVESMIANEGYLPYYEHHDLRHPDLNTGKPSWMRFDVALEDLMKKDVMLASRAQSGTHTLDAVKSGGAYSTEERLRLFGQWITGMSSGTDQAYGSSNSVFTRIFPTSQHSGHSFVYHPRALLRTRTYSFNSDHYGRLDDRTSSAPSDPLEAWTNYSGGSNETMLPNAAALLGDLEMVIFDNPTQLNDAIQFLKKLGFSEIRGVPIEKRIVLRAKLAEAIAELKKTWYKTHD